MRFQCSKLSHIANEMNESEDYYDDNVLISV